MTLATSFNNAYVWVRLSLYAVIQGNFSNLLRLELRTSFPFGQQGPPRHTDLSSLNFPRLRELWLLYNITDRLVLDAAHYPQLQQLIIRNGGAYRVFQQLVLNLPNLLNLDLNDVVMESTTVLEACFSGCPRLRRFRAIHVGFCRQPRVLNLDLPLLQHFQVSQSDLSQLTLRAPSLMNLSVSHSPWLENISLLPDGELPRASCNSNPALAGAHLGVSAEAVRESVAPISGDGLWGETAPGRRCVPYELRRVDVQLCYLGYCNRSEGYRTLLADPRVRGMREAGGGADDYDVTDWIDLLQLHR